MPTSCATAETVAAAWPARARRAAGRSRASARSRASGGPHWSPPVSRPAARTRSASTSPPPVILSWGTASTVAWSRPSPWKLPGRCFTPGGSGSPTRERARWSAARRRCPTISNGSWPPCAAPTHRERQKQSAPAEAGAPLKAESGRSLGEHHDNAPPILRPARLGLVRLHGLVLAVGDRGHPVQGDTLFAQVPADRLGTSLAELQVVFSRTGRIRVALDFEIDVLVLRLQALGEGVEGLHGVVGELVLVDGKLDRVVREDQREDELALGELARSLSPLES